METIICIAEEGERKLIEQHLSAMGAQVCGAEAGARVLVTGVGAINIIKSLQDLPKDTHIINIGYCGSANFEVGSLVMVTEARLNHPNVTYPEPTLKCEPLDFGLFPPEGLLTAPCYSNTDFVLASDYHDCVFDMELAYICALGFEKVSALKVVSDNLSLHAYHEVTRGVE